MPRFNVVFSETVPSSSLHGLVEVTLSENILPHGEDVYFYFRDFDSALPSECHELVAQGILVDHNWIPDSGFYYYWTEGADELRAERDRLADENRELCEQADGYVQDGLRDAAEIERLRKSLAEALDINASLAGDIQGVEAERDRLQEIVDRLQAQISLDNQEFCTLANMAYEKYGVGWWTAKRDAIREAAEAARKGEVIR